MHVGCVSSFHLNIYYAPMGGFLLLEMPPRFLVGCAFRFALETVHVGKDARALLSEVHRHLLKGNVPFLFVP